MSIIGSIIALVAALLFAAVAIVTVWGGFETLRNEIWRGFISVPPTPADRLLTVAGVGLSLAGAALLAFLAAGRIVQVALGLG